jgi:glycosyltransferase involved in cell wall biosynthesis
MRKIALIVPCYDEAQRFDAQRFARLAALPDVSLVFVNDGSTDATERHLRAFCERADAEAVLLSFSRNRGKAESVREGMRRALESGAEIVGYVDADLSTPVEEIARMLSALAAGDASVLLASRVRVLGAAIERSALRHYLGRAFATFAALELGVPVYDTQCGAKLFRRCRALETALGEPFHTRWSFDVELLGRLLIGTPEVAGLPVAAFRELPLERWREAPGSKLSLLDTPRIALELARVALDLAARRRALRSSAAP